MTITSVVITVIVVTQSASSILKYNSSVTKDIVSNTYGQYNDNYDISLGIHITSRLNTKSTQVLLKYELFTPFLWSLVT